MDWSIKQYCIEVTRTINLFGLRLDITFKLPRNFEELSEQEKILAVKSAKLKFKREDKF